GGPGTWAQEPARRACTGSIGSPPADAKASPTESVDGHECEKEDTQEGRRRVSEPRRGGRSGGKCRGARRRPRRADDEARAQADVQANVDAERNGAPAVGEKNCTREITEANRGHGVARGSPCPR